MTKKGTGKIQLQIRAYTKILTSKKKADDYILSGGWKFW